MPDDGNRYEVVYGDRSSCVENPFGHQWWISQRIKDMTRAFLAHAASA